MAPAIASHFIAYVQPAEKRSEGANRQLSTHGQHVHRKKVPGSPQQRPERQIFKFRSYRLLYCPTHHAAPPPNARDEVTISVRSGSGPDATRVARQKCGRHLPPSRYLPVQRTQGNQPLVRALQVPRDRAHDGAALRAVSTTPPLRPVAR